MFDAVLTGGSAPRRRFGPGFVVTVAAHVALVAFALYVSTQPQKVVKKDQEVKFVARQIAPPPPPPPPPPPAGGSKPKVEPKKPVPVKKPDTIVEAKNKEEKKDEPPKEPEKKDEGAGQPGGVEGGVDGGVPGGVLGGQLGGQLGSPTPPSAPMTTMQYDSGGMTPVSLVGGSANVAYTREAREAKIEGKVIARCTIMEDGSLADCRIIKGLPHLDEVVLANLRTRKYAPIMYQGRAVRVYFTFPFTFKLQ